MPFRAQHQNDSLRRESVNGSDLKKEGGVEVRLGASPQR